MDLIIERDGSGAVLPKASSWAVAALLALDGLAPQVTGVRPVHVPQIFGVR